jgi:hypothetical protein
VLQSLQLAAEDAGLPPELMPPDPRSYGENLLLVRTVLRAWAKRCPKPLVLFFDEIDALSGRTLISVLHQLRAGYTGRPAPSPHSVILCGMRDIRDYKRTAGGNAERLGTASPFNVKVDSVRLGDFTADEVATLYRQHTADTGQVFTDEAVEQAYAYTRGQPWLVNALAAEITGGMRVTPPTPITAEHVEQAKERLIVARATHLDSLVSRLHEPRVRQIIEPLIAGELGGADETYSDDVRYLRDLGLLADGRLTAIANPIYREVVVRVLGDSVEERIAVDPRSFVRSDGRLDLHTLLREFADFWCQHADVLVKGTAYHEVAPQLVIMAFIHRVVNGGGFITREYGVGRGRIDLLIRWPYRNGDGKRSWQQEAIELKVWHPGRPDPTEAGLRQLDTYLDTLRLDQGTLVVFDRRPEAPKLADRIGLVSAETPRGRPVTLLRA